MGERYNRQIILPGLGKQGQQKIENAKVLIIGMGGLGSPVALYLVSAGVQTLGISDLDQVEESNLHRQILHRSNRLGDHKVSSAKKTLLEINPNLNLIIHPEGIHISNALEIFEQYDLIIDGTDNFPSRYLINDAAYLTEKPLIYASIFQYTGQITIFDRSNSTPCYRCLYPEMPSPGEVPNCAEAGVLGSLCGIIGSYQAHEAIKVITGIGKPLIGKLKIIQSLNHGDQLIELKADPSCPLCGSKPKITSLEAKNYDWSCSSSNSEVKPEVPMEINITEYIKLRDSGENHLLLDVRENDEREYCSIKPSIHIPLSQFAENHIRLDPNEKHIIYCHHGMRSLNATQFLREKGFTRTQSLKGGIDAWSKLVDKSVPRY